MKNIACSNKGNMHMLTIASSIIVFVLSTSLQFFLEEVLNLYNKFNFAITHKVNFILLFFIILLYVKIDWF
jgi:hypothetical protein